MRYHHVQLAIPPGGEARARAFWLDLLGFVEIVKPPSLAARGGVWVRLGDVELHLGVDEAFQPATKAHPGLLVDELDALQQRFATAGFETVTDADLPGYRRFYATDPFGNRLEFLARHS